MVFCILLSFFVEQQDLSRLSIDLDNIHYTVSSLTLYLYFISNTKCLYITSSSYFLFVSCKNDSPSRNYFLLGFKVYLYILYSVCSACFASYKAISANFTSCLLSFEWSGYKEIPIPAPKLIFT